MATVVTRLFKDKSVADDVAAALRFEGFAALDFDVVSEADSAGDNLTKAGVLPDAVAAYKGKIADGNVVVVVRAPFGTTRIATQTMAKFDPIDVGSVRDEVFFTGASSSTTLTTGALYFSGPMIPAVVRARTPFQSMTGIPTLIKPGKGAGLLRNKWATPFSSLFGIKLLLKPFKTKLYDNPTPFSSMLRMPTLLKYDSRTKVW
ncbi:MAG: hypothetical protein AAGJ94_08360 [Pseudomonadota bacterium]